MLSGYPRAILLATRDKNHRLDVGSTLEEVGDLMWSRDLTPWSCSQSISCSPWWFTLEQLTAKVLQDSFDGLGAKLGT